MLKYAIMTIITNDTLLVRNPDLVSADMDGETVMMSIEQGQYFGIGGVGSRVWELLMQPVSVARIIEIICNEYAVAEDICQADMQQFTQELLKHGLILIG